MAHWTREVLLNRIKAIRVYGAAGKHAPHKPLLLLLALARVQRGESRWYPFALAETELGDLLRRHNPTGRATPEYPFWRLKNDGPQGSAPKDRLWTIRGDDTIREALERGARDVSRAGLLRGAAEGGFPEELQAFLAAHPSVVNDAVELILEQHFRGSHHEELLDSIGLPYVHEFDRPASERSRRDPRFRSLVLQAYNFGCAICGYDGRIGEVSLGIEAAHIKMHSKGGPDDIDNGLALCCFHHKIFDTRGALGLTDDYEVMVNGSVNWRGPMGARLLDLDGSRLDLPRNEDLWPGIEYIRWHREEWYGMT